MQPLLEHADLLLTRFWRASWQASVLILLVLLAQWALRRQLAPRWRHAMWLLVLIRLALPWTPECGLSLFNWLKAPAPSQAVYRAAQPELATGGETRMDSAEAGLSGSFASMPWWTRGLVWLWLAGVVSFPVFLLITNHRLGARVRRQRPVTDSAVLDLLEDWKPVLGVELQRREVLLWRRVYRDVPAEEER